MVRIRHTRGKKAPSVEAFTRPVIRIGSASASDVVFYGEGSFVSPEHAELRREGVLWILVDVGARGQMRVGGERVARRALMSGDEVELGGAGGPAFRFELEGEEPGVVAAGAEGDKVDLVTAQRIVQHALQNASMQSSKTAAIVAKKVAEASKRGARKNLALGFGVLLALAGAGFAALELWRTSERSSALVAEAGLDRPVRRQEERVEPGKLPTRVMTGREIYDENKSTLFVLGYTQGRSVGAFCTAFAIAPNVLATNAHCVLNARERSKTSPLYATQNDSGGNVKLSITGTSLHPSYHSSKSADSPDVGLVRVSGTMPKTVTLASDAELRALGAGDDAFVLGFPGRVMDPISPRATFLQGHVNRITGFDGGATTFERALLVQHDAVTRGGNSGSPIFDQYGHVVAIHAAHLDEEQEQQLNGQRTKVLDASPYRVGMRVDLLRGVPQP